MNGRLDGSVAIVTGASSGLGRRFARVLADDGAAVVAVARRADRLAELVEEITAAGGKALAHAMDVADAHAVAPAFDAAEAAFGTVDILVNNAAMADGDRATRLPLELIDRVIDVDFRAPFLFATEAARRLIAAERPGRIVNISSIGAYNFPPNSGAALYSAIKGGIVRMTETLALEWARHRINVNAIAPGFFATEMAEPFIARHGETVRAGFPRGRFGDPADMDSTLRYLVDPASHFVTGACIVVDDGQVSR